MKKIIYIIITLILLQLGRMGFKQLIFTVIDRNLFSDVIVNMIYMIIITIVIILILKKKNIYIDFFPKEFNTKYKIVTIVLLIFMFTTPIITKSYAIMNIISFMYNAIVTVVFEELIFRGVIYKELCMVKNDLFAYVISTILFGLWHIGYVDTVIWRTSLFFPDADIVKIITMKVITGVILGLIFGLLRYKNKNVYSSTMAHMFINTFGG